MKFVYRANNHVSLSCLSIMSNLSCGEVCVWPNNHVNQTWVYKNYMLVYPVKYVMIKSCMRWWCGTNFIVVSVSLMDVMRLDKKCGTHSFIGKITRYSLAKIMGHFEINFILFIKYKYMYYQEVHKWMEDWFGYII